MIYFNPNLTVFDYLINIIINQRGWGWGWDYPKSNHIKANQFHPYFDFYTKSSAKFLKLRYFKQSHIHHNAIRSVCNRGIGFCENK